MLLLCYNCYYLSIRVQSVTSVCLIAPLKHFNVGVMFNLSRSQNVSEIQFNFLPEENWQVNFLLEQMIDNYILLVFIQILIPNDFDIDQRGLVHPFKWTSKSNLYLKSDFLWYLLFNIGTSIYKHKYRICHVGFRRLKWAYLFKRGTVILTIILTIKVWKLSTYR